VLLPLALALTGEDGARRIDELSGYQFPGEYAWSAVPFSGSLSLNPPNPFGGLRLSRGSDVGYIRQKFLSDRLLARAGQGPRARRLLLPAGWLR
jgi:hypothetical protein